MSPSRNQDITDVNDAAYYERGAAPTMFARSKPSYKHLEDSLLTTQTELNAARLRIKELEKENADYKIRLGRKSKKSKQGAAEDDSDDEIRSMARMTHDVNRMGKYFMGFFNLALNADVFVELANGPPPFEHNDPIRYLNPENEKLGVLAEVLYCIPKDTNPTWIETGAFKNEFLSGLSYQRSSALNRLRSVLGVIVGVEPSTIFSKDYKGPERSTIPRIRSLMGYTPQGELNPKGVKVTDPNGEYLLIPPFVFPGEDTRNTRSMFRSDILLKATRVIMFGSTALNREKQDATGVKDNSIYFHPDRPFKPTVGLIAISTVMILFLLSDDASSNWPSNSHGVGAKTNINYYQRLNAIKQSLITRKSDTKKSSTKRSLTFTERLLAYWNDEVFCKKRRQGSDSEDDSEDANAAGTSQVDDAAEMRRQMEGLTDSESTSEDNSGNSNSEDSDNQEGGSDSDAANAIKQRRQQYVRGEKFQASEDSSDVARDSGKEVLGSEDELSSELSPVPSSIATQQSTVKKATSKPNSKSNTSHVNPVIQKSKQAYHGPESSRSNHSQSKTQTRSELPGRRSMPSEPQSPVGIAADLIDDFDDMSIYQRNTEAEMQAAHDDTVTVNAIPGPSNSKYPKKAPKQRVHADSQVAAAASPPEELLEPSSTEKIRQTSKSKPKGSKGKEKAVVNSSDKPLSEEQVPRKRTTRATKKTA